MAPTPYDIFDLNDAFAVEPPASLGSINDAFAIDDEPTRTNDALSSRFDFAVDEALTLRVNSTSSRPDFEVDEDFTNLTSSSSESVMPQFLSAPLLRTDGRQSVNPWDPRLVGDLALGVDSTEEVIERYGLSKEEFERLCEVPAFRRELSVAVRDLRENGTAYSEKCKAMSTTYLERIDQLIYDNATPASTVLAAAQWIAKMAKLEPREEKADAGASATQVNIQIVYSN